MIKLQVPLVNAPVSALVTLAVCSKDGEDSLKNPEDKRADSALKKSFDTSSTGIRAASSISILSRAVYLWAKDLILEGNIKNELLANRLLEFLMKNAFHQKRAVFRHNLEIIKTVVECWKDCLIVPYKIIFERFSGGDPNTKDNSVGIQLLGIVLANSLPPYDSMCGIDSVRYFQALTDNMALVRYKEVYAAAAEVLGLSLQYIAEKENVFEGPIYDLVIKQLKQHQNTKDDKFIVCLNKLTKNFPPLADRFMNTVFFLIPKLHGVMKTYCLEVVLCRAHEIPDLYLQLKSKEFTQIMSHRDDERQTVCLDIVYKMLPKLKPTEVRELLPTVTGFISHPSPLCRGRMYDILMWLYDNYRDSESQIDDMSSDVFQMAKEILLQGLIDENSGLQLIVRNFWSDDTRLPTNTLDRMLTLLNSLYSVKIETQYLSLATNFLLEMTSRSPDYSRKMFEYPLSECKFQDFAIDSNWRYRSTILTPLFADTQASQNANRYRSQEGSMGGQVRATQQQHEFTPTQNIRNSVDTFAEYTVPSSSESLSSSMLLINKRIDRSHRAAFKPLGPNFGKKRLGLPGDEVDSKAKGIDERAEILRLRRRFLKDQEKLNLIYARKGVAEQKQEKEIKSQMKMKQDAQITLYRKYRQGDLPDIQIEYSSLITPLQGVAQRDSTLAKQLFSSLFNGILEEMKNSRSQFEKNSVIQQLEMSYQHKELLDLNASTVSTSCLASLQQPVGILLLEQALVYISSGEEEPPSKRMRGTREVSPDVTRWIELAKLYRSIGEYDVLQGIFSGKIGTKEITQKALIAEARSDYAEAAKHYDEALSTQDWPDEEPTEAEKDFWELASLECYNHLTEWKSLEYCSTVNIDNDQPPDLNKTWSDPFYQETYLPYVIRSKLKLLLQGENDQSLLSFIDEAMKTEQRKALMEMYYSQELSLLYILQDDFDRAKYYVSNAMQVFMQSYSSIDSLLHQSRLTKLQSVQALTEIQDFINFIIKPSNMTSQASLKRLLNIWTSRYPDTKMDPMNIWDDIITNRCFFLDKIQERLPNTHLEDSMEVDGAGDSSLKMDIDSEKEDAYSMIRNCKFTMKMKMIESARKQVAVSCLLTHNPLPPPSQKKSRRKQIWKRHNKNSKEADATTAATTKIAFSLVVLGSSGREGLENGGGNGSLVIAGLNKRAFQCFKVAVKKAEEEVQSISVDHMDTNGIIDAYMTLANFCDRHLRKEEESSADIDAADFQTFPIIVVEKILYILQISSVPCWQFIGWISQLMAVLDKEEARAVQPTVEEIANTYPQAIVYPFMISSESFSFPETIIGHKNKEFVERIKSKLDQEGVVQNFIHALEQLSSPVMLFKDWTEDIRNEMGKTKRDKNAIQQLYDGMYQNLGNLHAPGIGLFRKQFIQGADGSIEVISSGTAYSSHIENLHSSQRGPDLLLQYRDPFHPGVWQQYRWLFNRESRVLLDSESEGELREDLPVLTLQPLATTHWDCGNLGAEADDSAQVETDPVLKSHPNLVYDPVLCQYLKFGQELDSHFGKGGSKLLDMKSSAFNTVAESLLSKMRECQRKPGNLKECSPWMSKFKPEFLRTELEIPGQYDGKGKPLPEYHAKISGFDERIKIMASIRKPTRIIIRGSDEQEYPFLVKGGEDLRQDQRIEQLFNVMNTILSRNAACSQRNMQLKTYRVIPMTTRIGLIEWLENTCTLKEFLLNSMSEQEKHDYNSPTGPQADYSDWLIKMGNTATIARYISMYKRASRTETVMSFQSRENHVPKDLLRRAFVKMSTTPEALLSLRSHFASSHALMCVSHWILGIGDRHLSNFMINMETGGMVGIDFGHAFGSATQFLPVPELMPFRLTRQFINLMLPMKESGLIYNVMVHSLRAYRADQDVLINTMDIFVKEPSLDWKNFELKQLKKGGTWTKEININEVNWYPLQKINFARRKLAGANPAVITSDELRLGHEKSVACRDYISVAKGSKEYNIRAREPEDGLSEETQVKCLIDQATDPNILGRVWEGWEPWM
ncbi:hypothetical protein JD844_016250 [Phrynosoma platyrhinos]|uniref:non-specific serine/threonine protein kinase n=1 Tax=Phrynosoma platyrhinos TaxID=52577 RepID=A0ABQ7SK60_PHRPL|nr:hypothetical protein JD844_016250 [Phrynosoma platyrhinos]